jgi:hypothetical protein
LLRRRCWIRQVRERNEADIIFRSTDVNRHDIEPLFRAARPRSFLTHRRRSPSTTIPPLLDQHLARLGAPHPSWRSSSSHIVESAEIDASFGCAALSLASATLVSVCSRLDSAARPVVVDQGRSLASRAAFDDSDQLISRSRHWAARKHSTGPRNVMCPVTVHYGGIGQHLALSLVSRPSDVAYSVGRVVPPA